MEYNLINLSYLEEVADGDTELIKELINIFIDQLPEFIDGFDEAVQENDWLKIAAIAHKAKSSVVSMGLNELGNVDLKNLELLAKQSRVNQLNEVGINTNSEKTEFEALSKGLSEYPEKRMEWIKENSNIGTIKELVNKFGKVTEEVTVELNQVLCKS